MNQQAELDLDFIEQPFLSASNLSAMGLLCLLLGLIFVAFTWQAYLNQQSRLALNAIEFKQSKPFAIYVGGPVENDKLFFVHQRPDLITEGTAISNAIYLGGNFKQAVASINNTTLLQNDIKLFIGYCGWDPNQLEEEIAEGNWQIVDVDKETIFATRVTSLWDELCK